MDDLLNEFLAETSRSISVVDAELVKFEQDPDNTEILKNIFRLVHTIRGTSGFLGLPRLEAVAHAGEDAFGKFRDGEEKVTPKAVALILKTIDAIKNHLAGLEDGGSEPAGDDTALIAELQALAAGDGGARAEVAPPAPVGEESKAPAVAKNDDAAKQSENHTPKQSSVAARSIRIDVERLDSLMTLVSELVLNRNQLLQMVRGHDDSEFHVPLQHLSHITTDLREEIMKARMQPIGNAWAELSRIVRDLAVEQGKKIELELTGAETELDCQVLELIKDPLIHMVRDMADHGIETPGERRRAGKAETGVVTLRAYHEGGHIVIEIADDGPGVGMDVAWTDLKMVGGTIELKSVEGRGSTFTIKIPLTLGIVSALVVVSGGQRFAVPQIGILELVRASAGTDNAISMIDDAPVLRLREQMLPLVSLYDLLELGENREALADEMFVVVARVGTHTFGIIVDRVSDTQEIVVKPITPLLGDTPFYSGNTLLGDGSVIMILDLAGIASFAGEVAAAKGADAGVRAPGQGDRMTSLVAFRDGGDELKAVPLDLVARLEEIDLSTVVRVQGQFLVQSRGHPMPLVPFNPSREWKAEGRQQIIVFTEGERSVGLAVDEIVDTVDDVLMIELKSDKPGLVGSAVIGGKPTDVIDANYYLVKGVADWSETEEASGDNGAAKKRVLLVDDSLFFRNLLRPVLSIAGYEVTTVETADEALGLREKGQSFDAIVSDIEMPGMNGLEFARAVRGDARWRHVPMVALSSHVSEKDVERGQIAGFGAYVAKFDREALVSTLARTIGPMVGNPAETLVRERRHEILSHSR